MANDFSRDALMSKGGGELATLMKVIHEKTPVIWVSFAEIIFMELSHEDTEARAKEALKIVEGLRRHFGGQQMYLPIGVELNFEIKFRRAYDRFDGLNIKELARDEGVPVAVLYKHFKAIRAEEVEKRKKERGE